MDWLARYGPPHLTWLVAALLVQRERQRWHHDVTRGLPFDSGALPGHPGWTFRSHGIGVCLDGPDGEVLDVDYHDADGAVIDPYFFANRIESVRERRWVERRLWHWRPSRDAIADGLDELRDLGAIAGAHTFRLAPQLDARAAALAADAGEPDAEMRWGAALESDDPTVHEIAHRAWFRARLRTSPRPDRVLDVALVGASDAEATELCRPLLARLDHAAGRAIEVLRARPGTAIGPEVAELLRRASLASDHPFAPFHACAYLFERGLEPALAHERFDAWATLAKVYGYNGNPMQAHFALLSLRHRPDRALALIRASVRSSTPICVMTMTSVLAAIDRAWSRRELAGVHAEDDIDVGPWAEVVAYARTAYPDDWDD